MSKSDKGQVKDQTNQQISQTNKNAGDTSGQLNSILGTATSNASSIMPAAVSNYSDIASTGGFDPSVLGRVNNTYSNLATTGGFSPEQTSSMYSRAAEGAKSTYDTAKATAQRTAAATGGYGDTSAAVQSDLARKGSEAADRAITGTTATLAPIQQSGMIAGAQGLASTQNQMAGNRLQATGGLTNIYGMNENQVNATVDSIIKNYQVQGSLNAQDLDILSKLATQPGVFDKIVSTIRTLGGAAAGVISATKPGK